MWISNRNCIAAFPCRDPIDDCETRIARTHGKSEVILSLMIASDRSLLERLFLTDLHKAVFNLGLGWQLGFRTYDQP